MQKNDHTEIVGYCDVDWAGDKIDRKFQPEATILLMVEIMSL